MYSEEGRVSEGMLWLPDWGKGKKRITLAQAVSQAARYYKDKYGTWPTVCRITPDETGGAWNVDIRVIPDETITSGHLLLTTEDPLAASLAEEPA